MRLLSVSVLYELCDDEIFGTLCVTEVSKRRKFYQNLEEIFNDELYKTVCQRHELQMQKCVHESNIKKWLEFALFKNNKTDLELNGIKLLNVVLIANLWLKFQFNKQFTIISFKCCCMWQIKMSRLIIDSANHWLTHTSRNLIIFLFVVFTGENSTSRCWYSFWEGK